MKSTNILSLRNKILLLSTCIPLIALSLYILIARDIFINDKVSYVFNDVFSKNEFLSNQYSYYLNNYIEMHQKISAESVSSKEIKIIANKRLIAFMKIQQGNKKLSNQLKYINKRQNNFLIRQYFNQIKNYLSTAVILAKPQFKAKVFNIDFKNSALILMSKRNDYYNISVFDIKNFKNIITNSSNYNILMHQKDSSLSYLFSTNQDSYKSLDLAKLLKIIKKKKISNATFEYKTIQMIHAKKVEYDFLVSFSHLGKSKFFIVSVVDKKEMLGAVQVLIKKSFLFFIVIITTSIILATLSSKKITKSLNLLLEATKQIQEGNYNFEIEIKTQDEIGILNQAFSKMRLKISDLISTLEQQNLNLEKIVAKRTSELKELSILQEAMIDSLGQGFFIFDKTIKGLPFYSKAAVDIYENKPLGVSPGELINLKDEAMQDFNDFCTMLFEEPIPFNDLIASAPKSFKKEDNSFIELEYHPIRSISDQDNNIIEKIIVIGTDKTKEMLAIDNLNSQMKHVEMITSALSNPYAFFLFLSESKKIIQTLLTDLDKNNLNISVLHMGIHSIKGMSAQYSIDAISMLSHQIESELAQAKEKNIEMSNEQYKEYILKISNAFSDYVEQYKSIFNISSWHDLQIKRSISEEKLENFYKVLRMQADRIPKLFNLYLKTILSVPLQTPLEPYIKEVNQLALKLNKKIYPVELNCNNIKIVAKPYESLFGVMIHLVRNMIDHGIEKEKDRLKTSKDPVAKMKITAKLQENNRFTLSFFDDGNGICAENIRKKLVDLKYPENIINESDEKIIYHIFDQGFSTSNEISSISGRGVGLSAIKYEIEKLNGTIIINTEIGKYTEFILNLPYLV